jgi:integrase
MTTPNTRPAKPTSDFPLFAHCNGQWAKNIKGTFRYYGPWADPDSALSKYRAENGNGQELISLPASARAAKPPKPRKDYPLYSHHSGQWAKKVRGKTHFFGAWADPDAALEKWVADKDALLAGRVPAPTSDELTVKQLVNAFLATKKHLVETGELKQRSWDDYEAVCGRIVKVFGPGRLVADLRPADFTKLRTAFAKTHGPVALSNDIGRSRVVFNYAYKQDLVDRPPKYGDSFKKPSRKVLRCERQKKGPRMFQADQLRAMIDGAGLQLRVMIYLGINCGFGNMDCATLPLKALDLEKGWVDFGRPKTGIHRRCPLWAETVAAIRAAIATRYKPKNSALANRLFVTKYKAGWEQKKNRDDPISKECTKVLKTLGFHRPGIGFYALRHTFETIGLKSRDRDAVRAIMGHIPDGNDMSAVYNEEAPDDARLLAVVNYIRGWLFPTPATATPPVATPQ